jgi:hypothetical protein
MKGPKKNISDFMDIFIPLILSGFMGSRGQGFKGSNVSSLVPGILESLNPLTKIILTILP